MRYVILGGGGSFGIGTASYLLSKPGNEVVGIGRNPLPPPWFSLGVDNIPWFSYRQFHVVHESDLLLKFLDQWQPDVIVNFAAQGEGAASWENSWRFFQTNSTAMAYLAEHLMGREWLKRFIHIGTSECYGSVDAPATEETPVKPSSPYAASKVAFDWYLLSIGGKLPWNIIRPSNCYGPGQQLHRIIPRAILSGLLHQKMPLHGGGKVRKSYLHTLDLARAIEAVALRAPAGQVYNVGPEKPTEIAEVAQLCALAVGVHFSDLFVTTPDRHGEDACYWLDSSKVRALGWEPTVGWDQGLSSMVSWVKNYLPSLSVLPRTYTLRD